MKHTLAVVFASHRVRLGDVLGDQQYGSGRCHGAPALVRDVHAVARLQPDRALIGLDFQNGYGTVKWADGLEACVDLLPGVAKLMASIWGPAPRSMRLFVEVEPSIWRYFHIYGSLIHGGQDGPPVWCLVLHVG